MRIMRPAFVFDRYWRYIMAERQLMKFAGNTLERKLDFYEFTENEKRFKEIYESEYGYLLMTPMYLDQLKTIIEQYPFLPKIFDFYMATSGEAMSTAKFNMRGRDMSIWGESEIYMCQHERYCYPIIHTHEYVEALYVYDGECRQLICGQTIDLHKGDFCILSPNAPHCVLAYNDDNIILNFLIQKKMFNSAFFDVLSEKHLLAKFFGDILYNNSACPYIIFPTKDSTVIRGVVEQMYREDYYHRRYFGKFMTTYFRELILHLLRDFEMDAIVPNPIDTKLNHQIVAVLNYIHVNYNHVTIRELSEFFSYSENYLSKILKEYTGKTFSSLINVIQMKNAAQFLEQTEMSIMEISQEVGCFDLSHFNKKFKKAYGITPTQYRRTHVKS